MNRLANRFALAACMTASVLAGSAHAQAPGVDLKALGTRTAPTDGMKALQPLIGKWRVDKKTYVVAGTPDEPTLSSNMVTQRQWIGDARFISDTTTGLSGGKPYFRMGTLGYNPIEKRYEWVTADNQTPIMMSYLGASGTVPAKPGGDALPPPIDMTGVFADMGITGEANVGKNVPMRTHIVIESLDRHVIDLFFTPPGKPEMLADHMVFERIK